MLLGRDASDFDVLLRDPLLPASTAISDNDDTGPSGLNCDNDDTGPSGLGEDNDMTPGATGWSVDTDFQAAQATGPTLELACHTLAVKEDVIVGVSGRVPSPI